jgi:hypothetical protein
MEIGIAILFGIRYLPGGLLRHGIGPDDSTGFSASPSDVTWEMSDVDERSYESLLMLITSVTSVASWSLVTSMTLLKSVASMLSVTLRTSATVKMSDSSRTFETSRA